MNEIYFIDLDDTLISNPAKWWIIDKNNPSKYLLRIDKLEAQLILNGFYKNTNLSIYYNGLSGYISEELYNKILKKKSNIKLEDIGISFREYLDPALLEQQIESIVFKINTFNELKGKTINLLTARSNKKAHKSILEHLNEKLKQYDIVLDKEYFVSDPSIINSSGSIGEKKLYVLLEHLLGYKINNNKIEPILTSKFDTVNFYDDEESNLEVCLEIKNVLKQLLKNSEAFMLDKIKNRISLNELKINFYLISTNEMNPFKLHEILLDSRDL